MSNEVVYDQITQYLLQIINIDIPFAEYNFGALRRMLILIVVMNKKLKVTCMLLFSSFYLESTTFSAVFCISARNLR